MIEIVVLFVFLYWFIKYINSLIKFRENSLNYLILADPSEYNYLFTIPAATLLGTYGYGLMNGYEEVHTFAALTSSLCCIGAISGLSSQKTSRIGNSLGNFLYSFIIILIKKF